MTTDQGARWAIGLMTGTSMDGIDAAMIKTDGIEIEAFGPSATESYDEDFSSRLRSLLGEDPTGKCGLSEIEAELTERHAALAERLLRESGMAREDIAAIGFHGQTIFHAPVDRLTVQIGNGQQLANSLSIPVVARFRHADVAAGGEGAPFAPLYHRALAASFDKPVAVLNLGGVANVTWLGANEADILSFDTGPASALLDDWVRRHTGQAFDRGGLIASSGAVDQTALAALLSNDYFAARPPKSLDRNAFDVTPIEALSTADGAATLLAFTVETIALSQAHFAAAPVRWIACGGGRRNTALMTDLSERLGLEVETAEHAGWDGDVLEAQAFAFLAVRSLMGMPLSLPSTTGVPMPMPGGELYEPRVGF